MIMELHHGEEEEGLPQPAVCDWRFLPKPAGRRSQSAGPPSCYCGHKDLSRGFVQSKGGYLHFVVFVYCAWHNSPFGFKLLFPATQAVGLWLCRALPSSDLSRQLGARVPLWTSSDDAPLP
jgi:hypothetical protein